MSFLASAVGALGGTAATAATAGSAMAANIGNALQLMGKIGSLDQAFGGGNIQTPGVSQSQYGIPLFEEKVGKVTAPTSTEAMKTVGSSSWDEYLKKYKQSQQPSLYGWLNQQ